MWRPRLTLANAGSRTERIGGRAILVWPRPQLSAGPGDASSRRASARVPPPYRFHSRWAGRASIRLAPFPLGGGEVDRKSTRLNSSHLVISYAVFCLKK